MKQEEVHLDIIRAGPLRPASNRAEEKSVARLIAEAELDALVETERAAAFLSVSPSTLNHWRSQGKGPLFREIGAANNAASRGYIRYRVGDLLAFSDEHCVRSTGEARCRRASRVSRVPSETPAHRSTSRRLLNIQQPLSDAGDGKAARQTGTARLASRAS